MSPRDRCTQSLAPLGRLVPLLFAVSLFVLVPGVRSARAGSGIFETAAVAADHETASRAGVEILRDGGNAVDAAVATSFTLSVVRPYSCGIGGGGFMVIYLRTHPGHDGPVLAAIDFRETAPSAAGPDYYENKDDPEASVRGGAAVAVPGTVAGLLHALDAYGTLDRDRVLAPAIRAAEAGFVADADYAAHAADLTEWFRADPQRQQRFGLVWKRYLLEGHVKAGDRIRVPEQAAVLRLIAEQGRDGFYTGPVAEAMVRAAHQSGGDLTLEDLSGYKARQTRPLVGRFRARAVLTMPPPSSGGVAMLQTLGILDAIGIDDPPAANSPEYIHLITEAFKHAFADRARWLADPAFVEVPVARLLGDAYIRQRALTFDPKSTHPPEAYGTAPAPPEDGGTSHFCVVDADGNAVACTETINLIFGSLVGVDEYGFVLNDEMDDFLTRRGEPNAFGLTQAEANLPAPGKRPLSSMSPTIVLDGPGPATAHVQIVAGASGGPRIITATTQAILNVLLFDDEAGEAVAAPRFHHQWMPDTLFVEPGILKPSDDDAPDVAQALARRGHHVKVRETIGVVQLIRRGKYQHTKVYWEAASDPRKGGAPAGY